MNVVLLLIDDMGHGDIAAHGNPVLNTPNFDQLYAESARFTNFAVSLTSFRTTICFKMKRPVVSK